MCILSRNETCRSRPSIDLIRFSDLLFDNKFADRLQCNGHCLGLGHDCLRCFLCSILLTLDVPAT